jgi:hypothetical protein
MKTTETKRCPRCEESKDIGEFGICQARKDGLNLYCKRCIREKIAAGRLRLREYKATRKSAAKETPQVVPPDVSPRRLARMLRRLTPSDRVLEAIRLGAETQTEIGHLTRLTKDELGEALANLLLWTRDIRTTMVDSPRRYFVRTTPGQVASLPCRPRVAQSPQVKVRAA